MVRVVAVDPLRPDPAAIREAAELMAEGKLVAFPTETVYGLGARGLRAEDVARVFAAKGRPSTHPLILHVSSEDMAKSLAREWSERAARLAAAFWPGPLTLVVPKRAHVPGEATAGLDTVAVRAPSHAVALALIDAVGEPIAAPSANAHTHVSPTTAAHVVASLGDRIDLVLDAGACPRGIESTVVTVATEPPRVLRPGALDYDDLASVVPDVVFQAATAAEGEARASPGLASKHYAPRAKLAVVASGDVESALARSPRAGLVAWTSKAADAAPPGTPVVRLPADAAGYARGLYAALHELEAQRVDAIVVEDVPDDRAWWAVRDRLARAKG